MTNKFSVNILLVCFVFSIFAVAGCAKKAPVAPVAPAPEEKKVETAPPPETYQEQDIGGTQGEIASDQAEAGEFPEMDVPSTSGEFVTSSDLNAIHFDFDKYSIKDEDREILNQNAAWLTTYNKVTVRVEGHCDARGTADYNLALGEKRATAAKNYLASLGVNPFRILTLSYGEEKPVCTEQNESCWAQNRRAEFLIAR